MNSERKGRSRRAMIDYDCKRAKMYKQERPAVLCSVCGAKMGKLNVCMTCGTKMER